MSPTVPDSCDLLLLWLLWLLLLASRGVWMHPRFVLTCLGLRPSWLWYGLHDIYYLVTGRVCITAPHILGVDHSILGYLTWYTWLDLCAWGLNTDSLNTWYQILDSLDTWHLVTLTLDTWHLTLDTWYLILGTWHLILDLANYWYLTLLNSWESWDLETFDTIPKPLHYTWRSLKLVNPYYYTWRFLILNLDDVSY